MLIIKCGRNVPLKNVLISQLFNLHFIPNSNSVKQVHNRYIFKLQYSIEFILQLEDSLFVIPYLFTHHFVEIGRIRIQCHCQVVCHFIRNSFNLGRKCSDCWSYKLDALSLRRHSKSTWHFWGTFWRFIFLTIVF